MDPQSAQLWWPSLGAERLAGLGAVRLEQVGSTDGLSDRETDGWMDRQIVASLNAPYGGGVLIFRIIC